MSPVTQSIGHGGWTIPMRQHEDASSEGRPPEVERSPFHAWGGVYRTRTARPRPDRIRRLVDRSATVQDQTTVRKSFHRARILPWVSDTVLPEGVPARGRKRLGGSNGRHKVPREHAGTRLASSNNHLPSISNEERLTLRPLSPTLAAAGILAADGPASWVRGEGERTWWAGGRGIGTATSSGVRAGASSRAGPTAAIRAATRDHTQSTPRAFPIDTRPCGGVHP